MEDRHDDPTPAQGDQSVRVRISWKKPTWTRFSSVAVTQASTRTLGDGVNNRSPDRFALPAIEGDAMSGSPELSRPGGDLRFGASGARLRALARTAPPHIVLCTIPRSGSTLLGEALHFAGGLAVRSNISIAGSVPISKRGGTRRARTSSRTRRGVGGPMPAARSRSSCSGAMSRNSSQTCRMVRGSAIPRTRLPAIIAPCSGELRPWCPIRRSCICAGSTKSVARCRASWPPIRGSGALFPTRRTSCSARLPMTMRASPDSSPIRGTVTRIGGASSPANGIVPFVLTYEELTRDYTGTVARLLRHLGSEAPVPPARLRRQSGAQTESFALRFLQENAARQDA